MRAAPSPVWPGVAGVVAAVAGLGAAELFALVVDPASSPLLAVGSFVVDIVPAWFKDFAIAVFGTGDKVALGVALVILVVVVAAFAGWLESRRPWAGRALLAIAGLAAAVIAVTRAGAGPQWVAPAIAGTVIAVLVLQAGLKRLREPGAPDAGRRGFLIFSAVTTGVGLLAAVGGRIVNASTAAIDVARELIKLPKPETVSAPIPAGAQLDVPGISSLVTPNDEFYRIDIALIVPTLEAADWRLKVTGMVEREVELSYRELLTKPMTEATVTLMCVSNEVGGGLVGNATWLGWPLHELLKQAGPLPGADMVLSSGADGFTAGTPLEVLLDESRDNLLAVGMNGEPLPVQHGFPVRMVVPGLYGYVSATKWVQELKVTTFRQDYGYWTPRGWSPLGPVKTASRIDVPRSGDSVPAGRVAVAGVAWAQGRGIRGVEVRVDEGDWRPARLAEAISDDTWVQWVYEWDAAPGSHVIAARATDGEGDQQSGDRVPPVPDGSEGWHTITVTVG